MKTLLKSYSTVGLWEGPFPPMIYFCLKKKSGLLALNANLHTVLHIFTYDIPEPLIPNMQNKIKLNRVHDYSWIPTQWEGHGARARARSHAHTHTHIFPLNSAWFKLGSISGRHSCEIWKVEKRKAFLLGLFLLLLASEIMVLWWQQLSFLCSSSGGPWGSQWVAPLTEQLSNCQRSRSCQPSLKFTPLDLPTICNHSFPALNALLL